ncbi:DNA helicase PcrA [Mahella australiensis]|uniref:ATP-dependent DNA helicase n=1 Tax=Mahella australiensis (strain DSM 15567 / CIP 107919 / 50-1 BON) TaxID=697281 RepID=F4A067_MAHA5|nr:DNA helicase PcrA [Mahella australiensis]AEE96901.1 ATP-dependent DNA helicase PcrA [Mahella australiensis 50-1 BON]
MDHLKQLNEQQQKAVLYTEGPLLVLAGAGSGKTRVLTYRIAHLINDKGVSPWNILAITFTNKAADEMKQRVAGLVGVISKDIWISTFHSCCAHILRREIDKIGYERNFTIFDDGDQSTLIKECVKEMALNDKYFSDRDIKAKISNAKNNLIGPADYLKYFGGDFRADKIAQLYALYQKKLQSNNALDFDDLIMKTIELFQLRPDVLDFYQQKFKYILVDEYQDTNYAQYMMVQMLSRRYKNLCVVGDDDQSIYGWRGADIRNILEFEKDFPDAKVIKLEQNYRSTQNILDAANNVIGNNRGRKGKKLWTANKPGERIRCYAAYNEHDEAQFICHRILEGVQNDGRRYGDFAVLYRMNAQSRAIEENMVYAGIPYKVIGGLRFYDRKEIKDIIAYLRVIANPMDSVSLRRIINEPKRGIGDATVRAMEDLAQKSGQSLFDIIWNIDQIDEISSRVKNRIKPFADAMVQLMAMKELLSPSEFIQQLLDATGYIRALEAEDTDEAKARIDNIGQLVSAVKEFENSADEPTLEAFLENVALISGTDELSEDGDAVVLMTIHGAKGLEFPVVFISGMEEGLFPSGRAFNEESQMEEERRLCYVAITRARQQLYMTYARQRMIFGNIMDGIPSRFLDEIPQELLEGVGQAIEGKDSIAVTKIHDRSDADAKVFYKLGEKIKHPRFGVGTIVEVKGSGEDIELKVAFPKGGVKQLLVKYAPIEPI